MKSRFLSPVQDSSSFDRMIFREGDTHQSDSDDALISFVVPVMNEEETILELYEGIVVNAPPEYDVEVIYIDDGSTDNSWQVIAALADLHPRVRGLQFRANRGKAAALTAGFRAARGSIVFTMDADLQDDPSEIPRFLQKLTEGYDLVSGWKKVRHDPWHKVLPSRIFNRLLSVFSRVKLHDHNCGFKCYRASLSRRLTLFGELHRMVPSIAGQKGFNVAEIVVEHHARRSGRSKYGIERFLRRFQERPAHFMNTLAFGNFAVGAGLAVGGAWFGLDHLEGALAFLVGVIFVAMAGACGLCGLVSEMVIRGGLTHDWHLPIVEDTGAERACDRLPPINTTFAPISPIASTESAEPRVESVQSTDAERAVQAPASASSCGCDRSASLTVT